MSETFRVGEIVDITIRGARVDEVTEKMLALSYGQGCGTAIHVYASGVTVERQAPAEWPPRYGDLWRDASRHLHFCADRGDGAFAFYAPDGIDRWPSEVLRTRGPLTLVHREPADGAS